MREKRSVRRYNISFGTHAVVDLPGHPPGFVEDRKHYVVRSEKYGK